MKGADKNISLKSDGLNACLQFSEQRIGSLKSDGVNGPLNCVYCETEKLWLQRMTGKRSSAGI